MLAGDPAVVNVTLWTMPLPFDQVTVPFSVMDTWLGAKLLAPMVTVTAPEGGGGGGGGGGAVVPPPPPPPPHAQDATTSTAASDNERIAGINVSSAIWFIEEDTTHGG